MEKYKKYYGVLLFAGVVFLIIYVSIITISPILQELSSVSSTIESKERDLTKKKTDLQNVMTKLKKLKDSITSSQKKIYAPVESDLGNDTLFFTLYNDVIEMMHANSIKIKSIDYKHNPENDEFVKFGKEVYFVSDINLELISNYVNLGKLLEDIQQYPYYIKINELSVKPFEKDKKILITNISLRLYAHTSPQSDDTSKLNNI